MSDVLCRWCVEMKKLEVEMLFGESGIAQVATTPAVEPPCPILSYPIHN